VYKVSKNRLDDFLSAICKDRVVYAHEQDKDQYHLVRANEWKPGKHTIAPYRAVEPLKSCIFRSREMLGSLTKHREAPDLPDAIAIGVKNCDLSALKIHDYVFLKSDPVDPFYAEARKKTILVSCDCTDARAVCFCPAVNQQPYAKEGFDINLSPVSDGYLVESGSDRGKALLESAKQFLETADKAALDERDKRRTDINQKVCEQTSKKGLECGSDLRKAVQKTVEHELWDTFAEDCVECGACNLVCCTCHCFLLADGRTGTNDSARVKLWDACLYRNFARVAGGANPRKHRAERLYNRFDKKFNFFPQVLGIYACDGCGRCVEACTGKIDIREVLKRTVDEL